MSTVILLPCDGCGQLASPEHLSRRLRRLEWATRFRPLHIQTLLLGGIPPVPDEEFLYHPQLPIAGEAQTLLEAVQISPYRKSREAVLAEFQKLGLMLTHVLECPLDGDVSGSESRAVLAKHLPAAVARIRRSLRPKRVFLVSAQLQQFAEHLHQSNLACPVFPAPTGTFLPSSEPAESEVQAFRAALGGAHV